MSKTFPQGVPRHFWTSKICITQN